MTEREYGTAFMRRRREAARRDGLCIQCCRRPVKADCTSCVKCLLGNADRAERRRRGGPAFGGEAHADDAGMP